MDININLTQAVELISKAENIVILSHKSPDGDTLGSANALYCTVKAMGKNAVIKCNDAIPTKYSYMFSEYNDDEKLQNEEYIISVDIADEALFGDKLEMYKGRVDLSIDHHKSSKLFAKHTLLDQDASATCQIMFEVVTRLKKDMSVQVANSLYTGIVTDTGCFRYPNTSKKTHLIAAKLLEYGADAVGIIKIMFESKTKGRVFVEKYVLNSMEFYYDETVAVIDMPLDIVAQSGADEGELDGIAAIPKTIIGIDVAITFREKDKNVYKISIRTTDRVDGSLVCEKFGGGGHARAAGCTINADYDTAKKMVLEEIKNHL